VYVLREEERMGWDNTACYDYIGTAYQSKEKEKAFEIAR
jgi:hypothetical protein